ncbi:hypothetical protein M9Y10_042960 [Tritrichomonas musculus]|uniref:Leucine Rich Repeat family protein n=1 Tax=Tritrichomonas musculus TaxID=1915356 RepID=A0ABR2JYD4_9EUKA
MSIYEDFKFIGINPVELEDGTLRLDFTDKGQSRFNSTNMSLKKQHVKKPITVTSYQNITYSCPDPENLVIEGEGSCAERINFCVMTSLSCFPVLTTSDVIIYDPVQRRNRTYYQYRAGGKLDEIKTITIKGNIARLDETTGAERDDVVAPFNQVLYPNVQNHDDPPFPFRFTHLEKIDLQGCTGLKKMRWLFFRNPNLKTLILPEHKITVDTNSEAFLKEDVNIINKEYAEIGPLQDGGCCLIQ